MAHGKGLVVKYFHRNIIQLQKELIRPEHHELREKYSGMHFDECIGQLAAEVNIAMDGIYTAEDLENLCPAITERLMEKRQALIIIGAPDVS